MVVFLHFDDLIRGAEFILEHFVIFKYCYFHFCLKLCCYYLTQYSSSPHYYVLCEFKVPDESGLIDKQVAIEINE